MFDFNASHKDAAPVSPMLFTIDLMKVEKSVFIDGYHLCVVLFSPLTLSSNRVVFDFSASLNDVAPLSPILLPVDVTQHKLVKNFVFISVFNDL